MTAQRSHITPRHGFKLGSAAPGAPRISVIVPTYNRARYIRQAIDSVLAQTFQDFEIIVVDDGSTDDTRAVVASYGDKVRYVYTENGGVAHARNVGMTNARGQYFAFLDSDDLFYPYMLETEIRLLDSHPDVGMVYAEMSGFDDDGFFDRYHLKTYHESAYRDPQVGYDKIFSSSVRLGDIDILPPSVASDEPEVRDRRAYFGRIFDWYLTNVGVFQNNMLVRREVAERVGPRNVRVKYWQELDYILRISRTHTVCFIDVPTYKLRYHPGQISTTAGANGRYVWARKQQCLLRIIRRHALADAAYYSAHRRQIDRHLAQLHRAVAIPLMLCDSSSTQRRYYARRARKHLARCWRYGRPQLGLWLLTFTPGTIRRFAVSLVEVLRHKTQRWTAAHAGPQL